MPDLNSLLSTAQGAETEAGRLATQAPLLEQQFSSALNQKFGESNPLIAQRGTALSNYLQTGAKSATKYLPQNQGGTVFAPNEIREFTAADKAAALTPLVGLNTTISQGYGGLQNILNAANAAYSSQVGAAQNTAIGARQAYTDAFAKYQFEQQMALERSKLAEQQRQANLMQQLEQWRGTPTQAPQINTDQAWTEIYNDVLNSGGTEYHIWKAIKDRVPQLQAVGIDVGELWRRHSAIKSQFKTLPLNAGSVVSNMSTIPGQLKPPSYGTSTPDYGINLGNTKIGGSIR